MEEAVQEGEDHLGTEDTKEEKEDMKKESENIRKERVNVIGEKEDLLKTGSQM